MRTRDLTRRMVLRTGAVSVALPLLDDVITPRRARAGTSPRRFIMLFSPNGTIPEAWFPSGGQTDFTLNEIMKPLEKHRKDLILFRNVDNKASLAPAYGDQHGTGTACLFTGIEPAPGEMFKNGMGGIAGSGWPTGPSVDQIIAARVGSTTRFGSLEFSVKSMAGSIWTRMSYKGPALPVAPESNPANAWDRIFAPLGGDPAAVARLRRRRSSVLDEVIGEFARLSPTLSMADRRKIDAHMTALRGVESRLPTQTPTVVGGACSKPARPTLGDGAAVKYNSTGAEIVDAQNDVDVPERHVLWRQIMTMVLACDQTRVVSLMMAPSRSDVVMNWLNQTESHHNFSHDPRPGADAPLIAIHKWYAEQVASLIDLLKGVPESGANLFDNTVMLWGNELGVGQDHGRTNIPILVAGSAGGYLKTGQYFNLPQGTGQNRILLSLCHAMGLPDITVVGNPAYCAGGPVSGMAA